MRIIIGMKSGATIRTKTIYKKIEELFDDIDFDDDMILFDKKVIVRASAIAYIEEEYE